MKFLFVTPGFPDVPGVAAGSGVGTYLAELTQGLVERGHECDVLAWARQGIGHVAARENVTVYAIPRRQYMFVERWWPELRMEHDLARAAARLDRTRHYDWVEIQTDEGIDHRVQRYFGRRAILRVHTTLEHMVRSKNLPRPPMQRYLNRERATICEAKRIFASSESHIRQLAQLFPSAVPAELVPLGLDPVSNPPRRMFQQPPVFLAIGSADRRKGLDRLGQALVHYRRRHGDCRCVLVCNDPEEARRCLQEEVANDLPPVELRSDISADELVAEYCRASVFVHLARYESFGYPLVEAAAYGTPIVSTQVGVASALLSGDLSRYLVDGDDPAQCADAIFAAIQDPAAGVAVQCSYQARFTRQRMVEIFLTALAAQPSLKEEDAFLPSGALMTSSMTAKV